ncbi:MAG: plasmid pRiA4b ORF-3 family protein [bacterium]
MTKRVYQIKITLKDIDPPVWRRIIVPDSYSFWDLHCAIQDALGWWDYHLHEFRIPLKALGIVERIGLPFDDDFDDEPGPKPGWQLRISDYLMEVGERMEYEYDFGDCWRHEILLEGILLREKGQKYPQCIGGERACPPEDCGGVSGYYNLLEIMADSKHQEYKDTVCWLGEPFDLEHFNPEEVKFTRPGSRLNRLFRENS